jgi:hypothetical protein
LKLTIDRKKWLHGEGSTVSKLLRRSDSKMCCLGFLAKSLGASDESILDYTGPSCTSKIPWPAPLIHTHQGSLSDTMIRVNDQIGKVEEERESELITLFQSIGIEVEFV